MDLVALVSGSDDREVLDELLSSRTQALGCRSIDYEIFTHPGRDPGCFNSAPASLEPYRGVARRALVLFDHEGSGQEARSVADVAEDLRLRLDRRGWGDRAGVIVIAPELENWVWSPSPHVGSTLGWDDPQNSLRDWLSINNLWAAGDPKPRRPKECYEAVLRRTRTPRSSALLRQIASRVSLAQCQDPSFEALRDLLRSWFPLP